jgi:hypothetical protein
MLTRRPPGLNGAPNAGAARVPKTRRPAPPARLRRSQPQMYDDEDSFDVPETALGGTKE